MNQTHRILPVYASDVSAVCSALYELGGMVVIHDPSGCNSTYNTHDETRWYDKESLIFISALTQKDAISGNDEKFYSDILETARALKPKFIAITNSPIPYLTGVDFPSIAKRLERCLDIPCFYVPANGMHDYTVGAGRAFKEVAARLTDKKYSAPVKGSVNIIGMTPLDYAAKESSASMRRALEDAGFKVNSLWAMDDTLENIQKSGQAAVNLVVSSAGLFAAKKLKELFGTPYVCGVPIGPFKEHLFSCIEYAQSAKTDVISYNAKVNFQAAKAPLFAADYPKPYSSFSDSALTLAGEPVIMESVAFAIRIKYGCTCKVLCPTEIYKGLLREGSFPVHGEEEIEAALKSASAVIADPLYKLICPKEAAFFSLPSLALSGRLHLKDIPDIINLVK